MTRVNGINISGLQQTFRKQGMGKILVVKPGQLGNLKGIKSLKKSSSEKARATAERLASLIKNKMKIKINDVVCDNPGRLPILAAENPDFIGRIENSGGNLGVLDHTIVLEMLDEQTANVYFLKNKENIKAIPSQSMPEVADVARVRTILGDSAEIVSVTDSGLEIKFISQTSDTNLGNILNELEKYGYERFVFHLILSNTQVTDTGLQYLPILTNLQKLDLAFAKVADIRPLSSLTGLKELDLGGIKVSDIRSLGDLTGLEKLNLQHAKVSDIRPLSNLTGLEELNLVYTQVSDISPLSGLIGLKELNLASTKVIDISSLSSLTRLERLKLAWTEVSDISPLSSLTGLKMLSLEMTKVGNIRSLSNLTGLEKLILYKTKVSDIRPLSNLTGLEELNLVYTQVSDISPLIGLTSLQRLNIAKTQVSNKDAEMLEQAIPGLKVKK